VRAVAMAGLAVLGLLAGCAGRPAATTGAAGTPAAASPAASVSVAPSSPSPTPSPSPPPAAAVPPGVTAGIVVFDRQTGQFAYNANPDHRFRSASLVKLLIVADHLWGKDAVPAADRAQLDLMLRSSDDAAATKFWKRNGQREVVGRMVKRLGLTATAPPPANQPGFWGYTALSAGDVVRVYQYLLEAAPAAVRDYVLGNLHQATKCGTDRYDQSFGIPSVFAKPWAAKQGWSGFGDRPANPCAVTAALPLEVPAALAPAPAAPAPGPALAPNAPDMLGEVLHTTGTVGADDRAIVAVLSVHRNGTPFAAAAKALTALVRSLAIPGAAPAS
jgi:hypothetical protein